MSLQVWLPLQGDIRNQGLGDYTISTLGTISWVDGKLGTKAMKAGDGTTGTAAQNGLRIEDSFTTLLNGDYSVSVWVKPYGTHVHYNGSIFSSGNWNTANKRWAFGVSQDNTKVDVLCNNYNTYLDCSVPVNEWTHLVCTCGADRKIKLYKNGEYIGVVDRGTNAFDSDYAWSAIGRESYASGYFSFNGAIQDFRLYDHCLSPMEVKRISQGLALHYPLSDKNIEPTINLVSNPMNFNGWNSYTNGYTSIGPNDLGGLSLICTNTTTWCGAYVGITLPSTGTYTLSCWVKPISRTSTSVNQTIYTNGGGINDTSQAVSWNNPGKWQRISMTRTYTSTSITFYLIAFGGTQTTDKVSCEWTLPQIEKLDHMTPFVDGIRNQTTVYDTSGYCNNGIITGDLTVSENTPKYSVSTHFPSGAAYINAGQNVMLKEEITVSLWMKYTTFDNPISCTEGGGWNFEALSANNKNLSFAIYVSGNYQNAVSDVPIDSLKNEWHMITGTCDRQYTKIYIDGELRGTKTCTGSGNIGYASNSIFIGGEAGGSAISPASSNFVGEMSDVRIYATALSATDVKSLYQNSAYIDSSGNVYGAVHSEV